jgi:pimeloyl-ACP methyl ester carboxylesterase
MTDTFAAAPTSGMIRSTRRVLRSNPRLRGWTLALAALVFCAGLAHATEPWKTLPPTPPLPAHAHEGHADVNGVRIWYAQWNDQAGGVPVLLLHGGYGNSNYFGHLIGFDTDPVFAAYLTRVRQEYHALSPTPDDRDGFNAAVNKMWETLPAFTAAQLKTFSTPTTIADGEHDEGIRPEHNRYLAATIPNARLVILPNVSHFAMLQNPAEFNGAVLDFLARE